MAVHEKDAREWGSNGALNCDGQSPVVGNGDCFYRMMMWPCEVDERRKYCAGSTSFVLGDNTLHDHENLYFRLFDRVQV